MKVLFLNPPHTLCISRRYRCSYYSPNNLLPPNDLLQLAACVRAWNGADVAVIDAIAAKLSEARTFDIIAESRPDYIVSVTGVDSFGDDMSFLERLKSRFPEIPSVVFGYYPTIFSAEVLEKSTVDVILRFEPEQPLTEYLNAASRGLPLHEIPGLAGRYTDNTVFVNAHNRNVDLDRLPFCDYSLVDLKHYDEAFFGNRCAAILASRGCPFACDYCIPTYAHNVIAKSPSIVAAEMQHLLNSGAYSIRFLDDTFTCNKNWAIEVCKEIIAQNVCVDWSCLARVDTLDVELLGWMQKAGCKRILVGIESYSPNVLRQMNKGVEPARINPTLALIRSAGIQTVGFFLIGAPYETDADFEDTVTGALAAPLDFLIISIMIPYAGTPFFESYKDQIRFNLLPYQCEYTDATIQERARRRYKRLYLKFYCRPVIVFRHFFYVLRHPWHTFNTVLALLGL